MPWKETSLMEERARFILAVTDGIFSFSELCKRFGISRKTGYKWLARYDQNGISALENRSRAPHSHPNSTSDEVAEAIIQARRDHPTWGARKLLTWLTTHQPNLADRLPAPSTIQCPA